MTLRLAPLTPDQWQRVLDHRGLVTRVVRHTIRNVDERDDALQDGLLGLCRAIQLDHGHSPDTFDAYATAWIHAGIREGRDTREGVNYRRDRQRLRRRHQWPWSLDVIIETADGPLTGADLIEDPADLERTVLARLDAARIRSVLDAAARDDLDRDIATELLGLTHRTLQDVDDLIAQAWHISTAAATKRRQRLHRRAQDLLEAA